MRAPIRIAFWQHNKVNRAAWHGFPEEDAGSLLALLLVLVLVVLALVLFEVEVDVVCAFDDELFIILELLLLLVLDVAALYLMFCGLLELVFVVERTAAGLLRSGDAEEGAVSVAPALIAFAFAFAKRRRLFAAGLFDTMSERDCDCFCDCVCD